MSLVLGGAKLSTPFLRRLAMTVCALDMPRTLSCSEQKRTISRKQNRNCSQSFQMERRTLIFGGKPISLAAVNRRWRFFLQCWSFASSDSTLKLFHHEIGLSVLQRFKWFFRKHSATTDVVYNYAESSIANFAWLGDSTASAVFCLRHDSTESVAAIAKNCTAKRANHSSLMQTPRSSAKFGSL